MNKDENLQVQRTKFSNLKRFDNAAFKDCIDLRNEWNFKLGGLELELGRSVFFYLIGPWT